MEALWISAILGAVALHVSAAVKLGTYNVDKTKISVSGISSGACMATQFHVAHSSDVMGVGMVAGVPFMCSEGNALTATTICMGAPSGISIAALQSITDSASLVSNIDSTSNMRNDRVWIFAGTHDSVVKPPAGLKVQEYYSHYVTAQNIKTVFNVAAEHCMPTDNFGGACGTLSTTNYINNCQYNAAYEMLNHIYGGQLSKPVVAGGQLLQFEQSEFFYFALPITYSMDSKGYAYVPKGCQDKRTACKLHIAFHGCLMGTSRIGDTYVRHAGYNEVGEANNIIILYPQVVSVPLNPNGCWDWFGYSGALFATKSGFQMTAVYRMMKRVTG